MSKKKIIIQKEFKQIKKTFWILFPVFFLCILILPFSNQAQISDNSLSAIYLSYSNPAFLRTTKGVETQMAYINRQPEFSKAYTGSYVDATIPLTKNNNHFRASFLQNIKASGAYNEQVFQLFYGQRFRFSRKFHLSMGVGARFHSSGFKASSLNFASEIFDYIQQANEPIVENRYNAISFSTGLFARHKNHFISLSMNPIREFPLQYTAYAGNRPVLDLALGTKFDILEMNNLSFSPFLKIQYFRDMLNIDIQTIANVKNFSFGLYGRLSELKKPQQLSLIVGFTKANTNFAYAIGQHLQMPAFSTVHEIALRINLSGVKKNKDMGAISCPAF